MLNAPNKFNHLLLPLTSVPIKGKATRNNKNSDVRTKNAPFSLWKDIGTNKNIDATIIEIEIATNCLFK